MKKLLSLLLALAMVFTLAACGGDKDSKKDDKKDEEEGGIAGKYLLVSVEEDGEELSKEDMEEEYGDDSYIELEDDGTAVMKIDGDKMDMEWEDDEIWVADDEDEVFDLDINEKKGTVTVTFEDNGEVVLTFEKEEADEDEDDEDDDKDNDKDKDNGNSKGISGTYYFVYLTEGGEKYDVDKIAEEISEATAEVYENTYIKIFDDGTAVLYSGEDSQDLEYDDSEIWPEGGPEDALEYEVSGDTITLIKANDDIMVLEK